MINALTYEEMIKKINNNYIERGLRNDYIGVLLRVLIWSPEKTY